jgi:Mn2+/Fe2+ NRAMP family transporter
MYFAAGVPGLEVLSGFALPRLPRAAVPQAVALVGSLIMPHNIFL